MKPSEYLMLPYSWCYVPVYADGEFCGYTAYIREFPGCIIEGDNLFVAEASLRNAACDWIAAALDLGQTIPEPEERIWKRKR